MAKYYMVQDLTREQLDELKYNFFWQDETQDILEGEYTFPEQIPDEIILNTTTASASPLTTSFRRRKTYD